MNSALTPQIIKTETHAKIETSLEVKSVENITNGFIKDVVQLSLRLFHFQTISDD